MPEFFYEAMDNKGKEISGSITSESKISAINKIREMGYFPTSVTEGKETKTSSAPILDKSFFSFFKKVKEKDLVTFMRQFATLVDAGLPILRGLRVLEKQNKNRPMGTVLKNISDSVESGNSLSVSMKDYEDVFSPLFINMIHAGEVGGVLDKVLLQMADYYEKSSKLKKKVKSSMVYPSFVLLVAGVVVYGLIVFIIPKFSKMFLEMDLQLPFMTQFLIDMSGFIRNQWYLPFVFLAAVVVAFRFTMANKAGRHMVHSILYKMPVIGDLFSKVAVSRFTRTLGTLINSGVQILEALNITRETVGNAVVENAITLVHDNLKEGESMVHPLTQANIFPPMVLSMVSVGEETGRMSEMLIKIAESYEDDVDSAVSAVTSLIEPALIITLAGIVGFIVIAMFLPLVSLISSMSQ